MFKYNGRISNIATNDFTAIISHNRVEEAILDSSLYSSGDYTTSTFQYSFNKKLEGWIEDAIAAQPKAAEDVAAGKDAAIGRLVGHVMKISAGQADAGEISKRLFLRLRP